MKYYPCIENGCGKVCRSASGLTRHVTTMHLREPVPEELKPLEAEGGLDARYELRRILVSLMRSEVSTSDIVTRMWSSTALEETMSDIQAWSDRRTTAVLDSIQSHIDELCSTTDDAEIDDICKIVAAHKIHGFGCVNGRPER